jgi:predicted nucleic acid-binding protein
VAVRRGRVDHQFPRAALADLGDLDIIVDAQTDSRAWNATLEFADRFLLTVYDAAYVELAQRRALPLATLDRDMQRAGAQLGLRLIGLD